MADVLYAQTTTASAVPVASSPMSMITSFAPFIVIMGLFYFLMIRPQSAERKKKEAALNAIQRGDRVLTRGGIYGTVADIKENILVLKVSENAKIEVEKSYVESVIKERFKNASQAALLTKSGFFCFILSLLLYVHLKAVPVGHPNPYFFASFLAKYFR